jgi:16S rRNA (guanine966-N2)-methyltransferase
MARPKKSPRQTNTAEVAGVRIIGGRFRGRKLRYSGDLRTRPMKDRVREALFNLLGPAVSGKVAIDLFAGTGALALEALSRRAARAVAIELHRPTARLIAENAATLGIEVRGQLSSGAKRDRYMDAKRDATHPLPGPLPEGEGVEVVTGNTFLWAKQLPDLGPTPWVVFCSPPYEFYVERQGEMLELLHNLIQAAPVESLFAVEADDRFDFGLLPHREEWDIRQYPPAVLGILEKQRG